MKPQTPQTSEEMVALLEASIRQAQELVRGNAPTRERVRAVLHGRAIPTREDLQYLCRFFLANHEV